MVNVTAIADELSAEQRSRLIDIYVSDLERSEAEQKRFIITGRKTPRNQPQGFRAPPRNWKAVERNILAHLDRHPHDAAARRDYERRIKPKAEAYKP